MRLLFIPCVEGVSQSITKLVELALWQLTFVGGKLGAMDKATRTVIKKVRETRPRNSYPYCKVYLEHKLS